jgi:chemotaxis protein MotB
VARRRLPEEHTNHEAWAIPYGDLITLLLAFFVVMYAISSVNAGKYRVVSESLASAFRGTPQTADPIALGEQLGGPAPEPQAATSARPNHLGEPRSVLAPVPIPAEVAAAAAARSAQLGAVARDVEQALGPLVMQDQVVVRNHGDWVEVEIRTDMLFGSGSATLAPAAEGVIAQLAAVLRGAPNPVRVEGHTDNVPIRSSAFPSNWELSAARSASVVRLLAAGGVDPARLAVLGLGEFRPAASNATAAGRNANRRVLLVILGSDTAAEGDHAPERGLDDPQDAATSEAPPDAAVALGTAAAQAVAPVVTPAAVPASAPLLAPVGVPTAPGAVERAPAAPTPGRSAG